MSELLTWMGYTARWRVKCISLTEANKILAGCKRLEKETRRQERLHFQEWLASMHQFTNLSANAVPFQLQAAGPIPRLAGAAGGLQEQGRDGATSDFSLPHRIIGSPLGRLPSPLIIIVSIPLMMEVCTQMGVLLNSPLTKRGEGVEVVKAAGVARAMGALVTSTDLLPPMEEVKSISPSSVVRRVTPVM